MVEKLKIKIILIVRKEDGYVSMSPIVLTRELRKNLEELEMVKVVRDGNSLIVYKKEEQRNKA